MNRVILAVIATVAAGAMAACSSSAPVTSAAVSSTPSPSAASAAPSTGPDEDACKVLATMTFDASTQDAASKTQDQMNAALNLLPQHDPLGTDALAAEQDLVTLDIDLVGKQSGVTGYTEKYQADAGALQQALGVVSDDCATFGVPLTASVRTAP